MIIIKRVVAKIIIKRVVIAKCYQCTEKNDIYNLANILFRAWSEIKGLFKIAFIDTLVSYSRTAVRDTNQA